MFNTLCKFLWNMLNKHAQIENDDSITINLDHQSI